MATESTATMRAAVANVIPTERLDLADVERPRVVADDDVLIRVEACGICGTDLHILDGASYRPQLPFVLGHEPVGVVVEAGPAARHWLDRRVTMTLFTGDGTCAMCLQGDERLCPSLVSITGVLGVWGGYADYVLVHAAQLVAVPDGLSASLAASLVDCGATAANATRVALECHPHRVLVLGAGPIGFMTAELLRLEGIPLAVVQPSALRRDAIARLGHHAVARVDEAGGPFDAVIDCTGSPQPMTAGLDVLGPHGMYVLAGYARVPDVDFAVVARKELAIRGTRSGRREDLELVLAATAQGRMRVPDIRSWPLSEVNDALTALRARQVPGKAVIVPEAALHGERHMRLALDPAMLNGAPVEEQIRAVGRAGYRYLELGNRDDVIAAYGPVRADRAALARIATTAVDASVELVSVAVIQDWSDPDEDVRRQAVDWWRDGIAAAVELGCARVNTELSGDPARPEGCRAALLRSLETLLPVLEREGIDVMVEPHPGDFIETTSAALDLLAEIDHPRLRYLHCVPHTFYLGGSAAEQIRAAGSIDHAHLADAFRPARTILNPPDPRTRIHQHFDIGSAEIEWSGVVDALVASGPDAVLTVQVYGWEEQAEASFLANRLTVERLFEGRFGR